MSQRHRLTEQDLRSLGLLARHRLVLADHVGALLGVSHDTAARRLRGLERAGLIRRQPVFHTRADCYQITGRGLGAVDSRLPAPKRDLRAFEHDVGVAWLWLLARAGTFGPVREILAERQLRSHDEAPDRTGERLAVRLGGFGRSGRERLHYPDLLLVKPDGGRIALELELTTKGRNRVETILAGYGADRRIEAVLYLVPNRSLGRSIARAADRVAASARVHVQLLHRDVGAPAPQAGRSTERVPRRCAPRRSREPAR